MAGKLPINQIICGDCSKVLPTLPKAKMIFADPPDNLGMKYERFVDNNKAYVFWLNNVVRSAVTVPAKCDIFWLSYYYRYQPYIFEWTKRDWSWRQFIWRFTFGQHNKYDCGNGYRPILRLMRKDAEIYPDAIRIPSARQLKYNDKRANPKGRVPDDVWEFPRVCGTFKERRRWHPNQHPEALIERIVKFSTKEGDLVIDMFAGTGTVNRVCKRLNRRCIGIEISPVYCQKIIKEMEAI